MSGHALPWFGCVLLLAGGAGSATVQLKQGKAAASLTFDAIEAGRPQLRLSSAVRMTFTVEGVAPLEVEPWKMESDHWRSSPVEPPRVEPLGNGRARWRQTFRLSPLAPGKDVALKLPPLQYREQEGALQDATWKAVSVDVTTRWTNPTLADAEDITPIEVLPPPDELSLFTVLAWAGGTVLGASFLGLIAWRLARRRRRAGPKKPPEQTALAELDRLLALDLEGHGEGGQFHTLVGDIVRRYLDERFGLQTLRQTTAECLDAVLQGTGWTEEQRARLQAFLENCDRVKFSGLGATAEECRAAADEVRKIVRCP